MGFNWAHVNMSIKEWVRMSASVSGVEECPNILNGVVVVWS